MEMENNTVTAARKERKNPFKRAVEFVRSKYKKAALSLTTAFAMSMTTAITAFAAPASGGAASSGTTGGVNDTAGTDAFNSVIEFFATWIGRIGLVVGFVGAVMFALAIKNDDADAKTRGLMTMASGFVVFAVTKALDMFMGIA